MSVKETPLIVVALVPVTLFIGWLNAVITAVQDESVVLVLLSIFTAPLASIYGLYLLF